MKELDFILFNTKEEMQQALNYLQVSFTKIRSGKPSPSILQDVIIQYYGKPTQLGEIANIIVSDARTLSIQPFDPILIKVIEQGIINSNLGFIPNNKGESIIIKLPPLTEERRKELSKQVKIAAENTKISIRNFRKNANNKIKKVSNLSKDLIKEYEEKIQKITTLYIKKVEESFLKKENEIMKI